MTTKDSNEEDELCSVADLAELLERTDLRRIVTYTLQAERVRNDIESMDDAQQDLQAQSRYDGESLETRFRLEFFAPNARYVADVGAIFETPERLRISSDLVAEFMAQVGLMAVFPYLREAISGLGTRLGAQVPVIGLLRRGDVRFDVPDEDAEHA